MSIPVHEVIAVETFNNIHDSTNTEQTGGNSSVQNAKLTDLSIPVMFYTSYIKNKPKSKTTYNSPVEADAKTTAANLGAIETKPAVSVSILPDEKHEQLIARCEGKKCKKTESKRSVVIRKKINTRRKKSNIGNTRVQNTTAKRKTRRSPKNNS
jgi:hypothetical protein